MALHRGLISSSGNEGATGWAGFFSATEDPSSTTAELESKWSNAEQAASDQAYSIAKRRGISMEPALAYIASGAQSYRDALREPASTGDDIRSGIIDAFGVACLFTSDPGCDETIGTLSDLVGKDFDPRSDEAFIYGNTLDLLEQGEFQFGPI
jgi:hypothetical protein